MKELFNFPLSRDCVSEYSDLSSACRSMGCDGMEVVWSGEPELPALPADLSLGYHLIFWPDWLDFWLGDEDALNRKFGSREVWTSWYGGDAGRETLLSAYRSDLERAAALGAMYVVFHVSDVSLEEGYTYQWKHTHNQVIREMADLINRLWSERTWPFPLLVENQWWPGFTFTDPTQTADLLNRIHVKEKGIMLDTGHLLNTCPSLRTEEEGADYVLRCLKEHGELCRYLRGIHLHQSLSGPYWTEYGQTLPPNWDRLNYEERFSVSYSHILKLDTHTPWHIPAARKIVDTIAPDFLVHELSAQNRTLREQVVAQQRKAVWGGT